MVKTVCEGNDDPTRCPALTNVLELDEEDVVVTGNGQLFGLGSGSRTAESKLCCF